MILYSATALTQHFTNAALLVAVIIMSCARPSSSPNIILLMGDDHGWDETGYNGHPHLYTPTLDTIAATGLRFDRFYAAHPSCSPTRASILTGRHPNRYGTFSPNYSIRPEEISIATLIAKAGYATAHFGKWHVGPVKAASPTNPGAMGFDKWLSHDNFFEMDPWLSLQGAQPNQFHGESSGILVEKAMDFMRDAKLQGRPFFVVIWFGSPHEPYSGLPEDLSRYAELPASYQNHRVRVTSATTGLPTMRRLDRVLQARYAEITAMDRAIGQLREWLSGSGMRQNTLLWYCGDNGTPGDGIITSPFRGRKNDLYEGGIRVPSLIEWPARITSPRHMESNAVTSDILPTLCDVLQLPLPARQLDGISLLPFVHDPAQQRQQPIFFWRFQTEGVQNRPPYIEPTLQEGTTPLVKRMAGKFTRTFKNFHFQKIEESMYRGPRAVIDGQFKLVIDGNAAGDDNIELFRLDRDPQESRNLAAQHPDITKNLHHQLQQWQENVLGSLTGQEY